MNELIVTVNHNYKIWRLNGKLHREDGPAIIDLTSDYREWRINNKCHREDGPAVIYPDGTKEWYLDGYPLLFDEYKQWFIKKISNPSYQLTSGDLNFIKKYLD